MKKIINKSIKLSVLAASICASMVSQADDKKRVIITMKADTIEAKMPVSLSHAQLMNVKTHQLNHVATSNNLQSLNTLPSVNAIVVEADQFQLDLLKNNKNILSIEEDPKRFLLAESTPYGINMVQANQIADTMSGNRKVCIMDTGYTLGHPDLPNSGITGDDGYGSNNTGNWYQDGNGHGTHVAGTIAAIGGNSQGVVGVNPSGQLGLHIVKVFNDSGSWAYGSDLVKAIEQCESAGANITSMSLGGGASSSAERNAFNSSYARGMLHIAAAGNDGNSTMSYPASYNAVVSVAAVDSSERKASFSQYNSQVEIAAPGVGVNSTWNDNGYKSISGTSMATPHVSGVAALVWSHFPDCSNQEVRNALNATAKDKGAAGRDNDYGHGIVQAKAAYNALANSNCGGVIVEPGPDASFNHSVNGLTVKFTNTSKNATSYSWSFGNGASSTQASPSYTYSNEGTYSVTLTATNGDKVDTVVKTVTVKDAVTPPAGCNGLKEWSVSSSYVPEDKVSYNGYEYTAKWWLTGAQPDKSRWWQRGASCK